VKLVVALVELMVAMGMRKAECLVMTMELWTVEQLVNMLELRMAAKTV
jgi:hypothetical protein